MAIDPVELNDIYHWMGGDLMVSATGDLLPSTETDRSKQRILRRLLTNQEDYLMHPTYGAGLPQFIGQNLDAAEVSAVIVGQMSLEESVQLDPLPSVKVREIIGGVGADISYVVSPDATPAVLSFDASA